MARYWKAWAALLVGIALQLLPVLADALYAGLVPDEWAPWVHVVLAVATAAGVASAPANAPKRPAPNLKVRDWGASTPAALALVALCALPLLALPLTARADDKDPPEWIGITSTVQLCEGVLMTYYGLESVDENGVWEFTQDTGSVHVEGQYRHEWVRLDEHYRSEGYLGWRTLGRAVPELVRVVDTDAGITSSPRIPQEGCPT